MRTRSQTRERGANPKSGKPSAPLMTLLEPSQPAIDRPGKERGKEGLRHDDAAENERAAEREVNQSGSESAPVIGQPFTDQKRECYRCHNRKRDRNARGRGVDPEELVAGNDQPVEQGRFLPTAFESTPASGGTRRLGHRPRSARSEKRTKIARVRVDPANLQL